MSDRLPYEEQLVQKWDELPLPDENMAWEDMKRRLEEDDDNGFIPIWLRGCGLWGLLLVILVAIGWWLSRQPKNETRKEQAITQPAAGSKKREGEKKDSARLVIIKSAENSKDHQSSDNKSSNRDSVRVNKELQETKTIKEPGTGLSTGRTGRKNNKIKIEKLSSKQRNLKTTGKTNDQKQIIDKRNVNITAGSGLKNKSNNPEQATKKNDAFVIINDSTKAVAADSTDSSYKRLNDSASKKPQAETAKDTIPKKDSSKQKSISFSAGMAMHQLLPVDGQKFIPYNSQGRKGSLADYIPSVFARMYKNGKWFLQLEFRYGAPQYDREVVYQQENNLDTFGITNTITSSKLKKTFYHQLPVSFNYYVLPNLSMGGGFVWNRFNGAVSEQEVVRRTVATGIDTVLSKGVILNTQKADTNFARSYFQALVETQYKWKRFSLGARYSFGLQPYLKFTLPGSTQQKERNKSLQVFLRYELWRSKTSR